MYWIQYRPEEEITGTLCTNKRRTNSWKCCDLQVCEVKSRRNPCRNGRYRKTNVAGRCLDSLTITMIGINVITIIIVIVCISGH